MSLQFSSPEILSFWLYNLCSIFCPYHGQVVILIGVGSSALDISMDIAQVAKEVHIASRSAKVGVLGNVSGYDNLKLHPMVEVRISGIWLCKEVFGENRLMLHVEDRLSVKF